MIEDVVRGTCRTAFYSLADIKTIFSTLQPRHVRGLELATALSGKVILFFKITEKPLAEAKPSLAIISPAGVAFNFFEDPTLCQNSIISSTTSSHPMASSRSTVRL